MKFHSNHSTRIAAGGVAAIAAVAFAISYVALKETAAANGFAGWQSWLWPLLIDLPILVFAFAALEIEQLTGQRSWFATAMIIFFSAATLGFNLVHSQPGIVAYSVAAMPPLALIVSFEMLQVLMRIVAQRSSDESTVESAEEPIDELDSTAPAEEPIDEADSTVPAEEPIDEADSTVPAEEPIDPAHEVSERILWADMGETERLEALRRTAHLSTAEAGDLLGCHKSTVGRARKSANGRLHGEVSTGNLKSPDANHGI